VVKQFTVIVCQQLTVTLQFIVNCKITLTRKTGYVEFQQVLNVTNSTLSAVRKVPLTVKVIHSQPVEINKANIYL
jgi:hypothetical protein